MADLSSITAVRPTSNTQTQQVTYGATVAVGNMVYLDTADSEHKLTDANSGSATTAKIAGIAMTPGVDGGQGIIATGGDVILVGTTMAVGEAYGASQNAGGIAPHTDMATNDYVSIVGVASSTTQLKIQIHNTEVQHA